MDALPPPPPPPPPPQPERAIAPTTPSARIVCVTGVLRGGPMGPPSGELRRRGPRRQETCRGLERPASRGTDAAGQCGSPAGATTSAGRREAAAIFSASSSA